MSSVPAADDDGDGDGDGDGDDDDDDDSTVDDEFRRRRPAEKEAADGPSRLAPRGSPLPRSRASMVLPPAPPPSRPRLPSRPKAVAAAQLPVDGPRAEGLYGMRSPCPLVVCTAPVAGADSCPPTT